MSQAADSPPSSQTSPAVVLMLPSPQTAGVQSKSQVAVWPASSLSYKVLFLVFVVLGSIVSARNVLEFGDLMILIMSTPEFQQS